MRFRGPGELARAYVIAHEVGHHVQKLTGTFHQIEETYASTWSPGPNPTGLPCAWSCKPICYAGVWGHHAGTMNQLDPGDVAEALNAATAMGGDDRLQRGKRRVASCPNHSRTAHPSSAYAGSSAAWTRAARRTATRFRPAPFAEVHPAEPDVRFSPPPPNQRTTARRGSRFLFRCIVQTNVWPRGEARLYGRVSSVDIQRGHGVDCDSSFRMRHIGLSQGGVGVPHAIAQYRNAHAARGPQTMPSIYRPKHSVIAPEADVARGAHIDTEARPPQSTDSDDQTSWVGRRKAQPIEVLLPATRRWLDTLPKEIRPHALAEHFPRLANLIFVNWNSPNDCSAFISSLLVDQRGGRRGFPADVLQDIQNLRMYYTRLHPIVDWER